MQNGRRDLPVYALGHAHQELDRLSLQARILEPYTRRLFVDAGISTGMRVLDVGCGSGDVSMLVGEIVGPSGQVVGVDKAGAAIERASARAADRGLSNLHFIERDLQELSFDEPFDAVVGRLVLMYLPDPGRVLRRLTGMLRPGGIVAFHEFDIGAARTLPEGPLFARCGRWILATFAAAGAETRMGLKLHSAFIDGGLPAPSMRLEGEIGAGPDFFGYAMVADVVRSLLPLMEKFGIATAKEIDIDTLADRLREEVTISRGSLVIPEFIGAWSRLGE